MIETEKKKIQFCTHPPSPVHLQFWEVQHHQLTYCRVTQALKSLMIWLQSLFETTQHFLYFFIGAESVMPHLSLIAFTSWYSGAHNQPHLDDLAHHLLHLLFLFVFSLALWHTLEQFNILTSLWESSVHLLEQLTELPCHLWSIYTDPRPKIPLLRIFT